MLEADRLLDMKAGCALAAAGQEARALELYAEGCDLARSSGDEQRLLFAQGGIAEIHRGRGDFAAAEPIYLQSIEYARQQDDLGALLVRLFNFASLLVATGRLDEARDALRESRFAAKRFGYKGFVECATDVVAALASVLGEHAIAARFHGAMLRQMEEAGICHDPVDEGFIAPRIAVSREAMGDAAFEAALAGGWSLSYEAAVTELDRWLGVEGPGE